MSEQIHTRVSILNVFCLQRRDLVMLRGMNSTY